MAWTFEPDAEALTAMRLRSMMRIDWIFNMIEGQPLRSWKTDEIPDANDRWGGFKDVFRRVGLPAGRGVMRASLECWQAATLAPQVDPGLREIAEKIVIVCKRWDEERGLPQTEMSPALLPLLKCEWLSLGTLAQIWDPLNANVRLHQLKAAVRDERLSVRIVGPELDKAAETRACDVRAFLDVAPPQLDTATLEKWCAVWLEHWPSATPLPADAPASVNGSERSPRRKGDSKEAERINLYRTVFAIAARIHPPPKKTTQSYDDIAREVRKELVRTFREQGKRFDALSEGSIASLLKNVYKSARSRDLDSPYFQVTET
jgi:hypothetical protein